MALFWSNLRAQIHLGSSQNCLKDLPNQSVQCCITSPPYWGFRSYNNSETDKQLEIGMEESVEIYIDRLLEVFYAVYRVLRDDGTLWLNLGDGYGPTGELTGVPWRVALSLRDQGWKLRQEIIWYSPNKIPEPVTDRCVKSHEHIFLFVKGNDYYYDAVSLANQANKRDVWVVPSKPFPGAHTATYSPELITPCILAGTSEQGCCYLCKCPYRRQSVRINGVSVDSDAKRDHSLKRNRNGLPGSGSTLDGKIAKRETIGWFKTCICNTNEVIPCTILDPFLGSGTTVATALELGRHGIGIELSERYLNEIAIPRIKEVIWAETAKTSLVAKDMPPAPRKLKNR